MSYLLPPSLFVTARHTLLRCLLVRRPQLLSIAGSLEGWVYRTLRYTRRRFDDIALLFKRSRIGWQSSRRECE